MFSKIICFDTRQHRQQLTTMIQTTERMECGIYISCSIVLFFSLFTCSHCEWRNEFIGKLTYGQGFTICTLDYSIAYMCAMCGERAFLFRCAMKLAAAGATTMRTYFRTLTIELLRWERQ